jgi:hypothetical protein
MTYMAAEAFIHCRVSAATKEALAAAAQRQCLTESALLKRMIELMLYTTVPIMVLVQRGRFQSR